jgi:hypothetical protein
VMASFNVMDFGPQRLGSLTYPEIESRYREFHRMSSFEDILGNSFKEEGNL